MALGNPDDACKEAHELIRSKLRIFNQNGFFVDNTHAVGCLLRRGAAVREQPARAKRDYRGRPLRSPQEQFLELTDDLIFI